MVAVEVSFSSARSVASMMVPKFLSSLLHFGGNWAGHLRKEERKAETPFPSAHDFLVLLLLP